MPPAQGDAGISAPGLPDWRFPGPPNGDPSHPVPGCGPPHPCALPAIRVEADRSTLRLDPITLAALARINRRTLDHGVWDQFGYGFLDAGRFVCAIVVKDEHAAGDQSWFDEFEGLFGADVEVHVQMSK